MVTPLNRKRYSAKSACYCVKCGNDIKDPNDAFWVRLVDLHDGYNEMVLHPESVLGKAEDLGFWRMCPECEDSFGTKYGPKWAFKHPLPEAADSPVFFYEREFYVLSNFSSFTLELDGYLFQTSEHAYHYRKFCAHDNEDMSKSKRLYEIRQLVQAAKSAHDAQKIARENKDFRRPDWDEIKVSVMKEILLAKVAQHPYVMKKLMETGDREIIEDSWRDNYWGWGVKKDGLNKLGKLWMEVREEIRKAQ